ncbi:MAG TPA: DinB family protein [Actinopolymorphaceae bacterium]|jgi:uncharacterized damage-inducible protein DinB|nr:DinB family protein [Actinopolymorphaceae bacterium]
MGTNLTADVPAPLLVTSGTEREVLAAFLDFHRGVVVRKASGVSDDDARRRLVPSLTTLAGLVHHLTTVEREWFHRLLATPQPPPPVEEDDESWRPGDDHAVADLLADYEQACARSRDNAADFGLDDEVPHNLLGTVSLRWIYVHVIEETARHAGHADILRELTDGVTGVTGTEWSAR